MILLQNWASVFPSTAKCLFTHYFFPSLFSIFLLKIQRMKQSLHALVWWIFLTKETFSCEGISAYNWVTDRQFCYRMNASKKFGALVPNDSQLVFLRRAEAENCPPTVILFSHPTPVEEDADLITTPAGKRRWRKGEGGVERNWPRTMQQVEGNRAIYSVYCAESILQGKCPINSGISLWRSR